MNDSINDTQPNDEDSQFDYDQFEEETDQPMACSACGQVLETSYFSINGGLVCPECCQKFEESRVGGSRMRRFVWAMVFGLIAAAFGAGIYFAVAALTGYEFGLIAIVVGLLVGGAVRWGSDARGGWFYQLLAVFLTYSAIVSTYIPMIIAEVAKQFPEESPTTSAPATSTAPADLVETQPGTTTAPASDGNDSASSRSLDQDELTWEEMSGGQKAFAVVIFLLVTFVIAFVAPFFSGQIMGLLIIGIGLYEAWIINRRPRVLITSPYEVPVSTDAYDHTQL